MDFFNYNKEKIMLDQHEQNRPLAYYLARKVAHHVEHQAPNNPHMQDAGGTLELTGGQNTSLDVVYDF
jgi:hypothetical protein